MRIGQLAVFASLALALVAGPAPAQVETQVDTPPDWIKKPTSEDLLAVWPQAAMKSGMFGKAAVHCKVNRLGGLFDCRVVSESPEGSGFGRAAIALTSQFLMKPAMKGGQAVDYDGVTIPINFDGRELRGANLMTRKVASIGRWAMAPSYVDVVAAYPPKARAGRVTGHVSVDCTIRADGRVAGCTRIVAQPDNMGFADAARKLVPRFVAPLTLPDGQSTRGMAIRIPFTFAPEMLDAAEPVVGKPRWIGVPSVEQMKAILPSTNGPAQTVRVQMNCRVIGGGKVDDCRVETETPEGQGYGAIAVKMADAFELSTWTNEGLPTIGGRVMIPIRFAVGSPAAKP